MIGRAFHREIRPPGSKSITNRAILLAALARGQSVLTGALTDADDAQVMLAAVCRLGAQVQQVGDQLRITGVGGRWTLSPGERAEIDLHNAGTATRFLAAAAVLAPGGSTVVIDGDARMRQRPIAELVDALHALGVPARFASTHGYPPVEVPGGAFDSTSGTSGREVRFGVTSSSQFISAVLLAAPFLPGGLVVRLPHAPTSVSYIDMTLRVLAQAGLRGIDDQSSAEAGRTLRVPYAPLDGFVMDVEPDASGATYFHAAAAMVPGASVVVPGLDLHPSREPLQGDTRFVGVLSAAGASIQRLSNALSVTGRDAIQPFEADLADMPDTAMTAALVACCARPTPANPSATSILHGLRTLRVKETDRLAALQTELAKIGARVEIRSESWRGQLDEALVIVPPTPSQIDDPAAPAVYFDTYHDHRMAMALALIGLRRANVFIRDPKCVAKTYPGFWRHLAGLYPA